MNGKLRIIIPSTRTADIDLIFENVETDLSFKDEMKYPLEILASNINVNIIVKGTTELTGFSGRRGNFLESSDNDGDDGSPAIYTKSNITFASIDSGRLYLQGGSGGEGFWDPSTKQGGKGGNGAAALYAEKNVIIKNFENGLISFRGGEGGGSTTNYYGGYLEGGVGGDGMTVGGTLTFESINHTIIDSLGGNGGYGGNTDALLTGKGGKAGHAIHATGDVIFKDSIGLTLTLKGNYGGQSAAHETAITNPGGNGILSAGNVYFQDLTNLTANVTGGRHGYMEYNKSSLTGEAGIKATFIYFQRLTNSNVIIEGGNGLDGDTQASCTRGGNAVNATYSYLIDSTSTTVTFKGGDGGIWSAILNPDTDGWKDMGPGYVFTSADKDKASSKITFVNGTTHNTGNPDDWTPIS